MPDSLGLRVKRVWLTGAMPGYLLILLAVSAAALATIGLIAWYDHRHPFDWYDDCDYCDPECCGGGAQEDWR